MFYIYPFTRRGCRNAAGLAPALGHPLACVRAWEPLGAACSARLHTPRLRSRRASLQRRFIQYVIDFQVTGSVYRFLLHLYYLHVGERDMYGTTQLLEGAACMAAAGFPRDAVRKETRRRRGRAKLRPQYRPRRLKATCSSPQLIVSVMFIIVQSEGGVGPA